MNRLSFKIYPKKYGRAELVMKTSSKMIRIKNLAEAMAFKAKMKQLGASLRSQARLQAMFTLRNENGGVWLLDCDARTDEARVQLWITDFSWYGKVVVLEQAIRLL